MTASSFEWDRDVNVPVSGRTARSRHASATGAQAASVGRGVRTRAYLQVLYQAGARGLNDDQAAAILGIYRTSINSIRNGSMNAGFVAETGQYDAAIFANRSTRRQRYALTASGRAFVEGR